MFTLYESIKSLCDEAGITGGKMCVELGLSKSLMTDLKSGRKRGITDSTARKIADYFGVSVDRVLGAETKKDPATMGEVSDDDLKFALAGDVGRDLTDEDMAAIRAFAAWTAQERRKKK